MTTDNLPAEAPRTSRIHSLWAASGPMRGVLIAGAISGLISAGIGARIVMRLVALANPGRDGVTTDAVATVGEITLEGTLNLFALGLFAGLLGGLVYLGVRRWLPVPAAWHGLAYGLVSLLTVGNLLFDSNNADFQIFEPVLLVIGLFAVLFLVNGLILGALADRIHPEPAYAPSLRVSRAVMGVMAVVCAIGAFGLIAGMVQMVDDEGTCYSAAGEGNGCAVRTADVEP